MVIERMQEALRRVFDPNPVMIEWGSYCAPNYSWEINYQHCCDDAETYRKYLEEELGKAVYDEKIPTDYVRSLNAELNQITMMWKEFFVNEFSQPWGELE